MPGGVGRGARSRRRRELHARRGRYPPPSSNRGAGMPTDRERTIERPLPAPKPSPRPARGPARAATVPELSVVIVNYNTCDHLLRCLRSLAEQRDGLLTEILVVDNASTDESAERVAEEFPEVRLVCNETNRGYAAANNEGLRSARGRRLLLLNPDT